MGAHTDVAKFAPVEVGKILTPSFGDWARYEVRLLECFILQCCVTQQDVGSGAKLPGGVRCHEKTLG